VKRVTLHPLDIGYHSNSGQQDRQVELSMASTQQVKADPHTEGGPTPAATKSFVPLGERDARLVYNDRLEDIVADAQQRTTPKS
jgi:hypothetical protein